ncbi:MAG: flavin-containing monooxygenase, partial [Alphaproteobacteria bacterium]
MTNSPGPRSQPAIDADSSDRRDFDVVVVGGGFAGIGAAIRLRQAGFDFVLLEKASELGGVWRENVYPDCACDVPSSFYSFSFAPKPDWSHVFAHQPEIKRYAADTARAFGVSDAIRFGHEMLAARWDPAASRWQVDTDRGRFSARFVVMASGPMHVPVVPALPGLESFPGASFHSAKWNHDVDLRGKRVAVIGTGASAIQFVPAIQPTVERMAVFQRTAPWVLPKLDAPVSPAWQERFRRHPVTQRALRALLYVQFEFLNWSLNRPRLRKRLERAAIANAYRNIEDEALRAKVVPDYAIGCKRVLQSNVWYRALSRPNVSVHGGVERVEGDTIVSADGTRFEADVI